jgi:hypothetical protein
MKKTRKYGTAKGSTPVLRSPGTAVLGRVIPELTICGVFDASDSDVSFIARGISTTILAQFSVDVLQATGHIGRRSSDDE